MTGYDYDERPRSGPANDAVTGLAGRPAGTLLPELARPGPGRSGTTAIVRQGDQYIVRVEFTRASPRPADPWVGKQMAFPPGAV